LHNKNLIIFAIFLQERLESFGLSTVGMVGLTSDGAATMVAAGRRLGIIHQLCHAHGVHLAVMDVIYKGRQAAEQEEEENEGNSDSQDEEEGGMTDDLGEEEGGTTDDLSEENMMAENFYLEEHPEDSLLPDLSFTYKEVINDIRTIIKSFRHDRNLC
jgi:hypothetical protein